MTPPCRPERSEGPGFAFERSLPRILQAFSLQNDTKSFSADTVEDFFFPLAATLHINHLLFSGKYVPIFSFYEKCTT